MTKNFKNKFKEFNLIGSAFLLYQILFIAIITGMSIVLFSFFTNIEKNSLEAIPLIITSILCTTILYFIRFKKAKLSDYFQIKNKLKINNFIFFAGVTALIQLTFPISSYIIEHLFNMFNLSLKESLQMSSESSTCMLMLMYSAFLAPITEEIIFRGIFLNWLKKYGKSFAIITSAFLFSIFHGNFMQLPITFVIGLLFGFVAYEYSIKYSILLHIINNFVYGELLTKLTNLFPENIHSLINTGFLAAMALLGIIGILLNYKYIKLYIVNEKIPFKDVFKFIFSFTVIISTIICLLNAFQYVKPL